MKVTDKIYYTCQQRIIKFIDREAGAFWLSQAELADTSIKLY